MSNSRKFPHMPINPTMGDYFLEAWPEDIAECTQRVLSGEHDNTLLGQFGGLSRMLSELAVARYYRAGASAEDTLEVLDQAALASANWIALITDKSHVDIEWQGTTRSVPGFRAANEILSPHLTAGLRLAKIASRDAYLGILADFDIATFETRIPANHVSIFYARYLQRLFVADDAEAARLRDVLTPHIPPGNNPDVVLGATRQRVHFSLLDGNPKSLKKNIDAHLSAHKNLFDSDRNNNRGSILGMMSLSMLAVAVEARNRGIDIRWRNGYVPDDIIDAVLSRQ